MIAPAASETSSLLPSPPPGALSDSALSSSSAASPRSASPLGGPPPRPRHAPSLLRGCAPLTLFLCSFLFLSSLAAVFLATFPMGNVWGQPPIPFPTVPKDLQARRTKALKFDPNIYKPPGASPPLPTALPTGAFWTNLLFPPTNGRTFPVHTSPYLLSLSPSSLLLSSSLHSPPLSTPLSETLPFAPSISLSPLSDFDPQVAEATALSVRLELGGGVALPVTRGSPFLTVLSGGGGVRVGAEGGK